MADEKAPETTGLDDRHAAWAKQTASAQQSDAAFLASAASEQKILAALAATLQTAGLDLKATTAEARQAFEKEVAAALAQGKE
ncbi:MAG TPA: hypothetical protein VMW27_08525 [Thermoanaerobaculia bacterium]|nr:hypothetical protein [Thermoanaerobaculia bacterium]